MDLSRYTFLQSIIVESPNLYIIPPPTLTRFEGMCIPYYKEVKHLLDMTNFTNLNEVSLLGVELKSLKLPHSIDKLTVSSSRIPLASFNNIKKLELNNCMNNNKDEKIDFIESDSLESLKLDLMKITFSLSKLNKLRELKLKHCECSIPLKELYPKEIIKLQCDENLLQPLNLQELYVTQYEEESFNAFTLLTSLTICSSNERNITLYDNRIKKLHFEHSNIHNLDLSNC